MLNELFISSITMIIKIIAKNVIIFFSEQHFTLLAHVQYI